MSTWLAVTTIDAICASLTPSADTGNRKQEQTCSSENDGRNLHGHNSFNQCDAWIRVVWKQRWSKGKGRAVGRRIVESRELMLWKHLRPTLPNDVQMAIGASLS